MPLGSVVSTCECGMGIDEDGYHLLTCKTGGGGGAVWTHETLASVWFEHFGRWGQDGMKFLHRLSHQSVNEDGKKNSKEFMTFWRCCLSVALQRCNARVIGRKLSRPAKSKDVHFDSHVISFSM